MVFFRLWIAKKYARTVTRFFFERNWQNGHFCPPYFKNSARKNFFTKKSEFWEVFLNGWQSAIWSDFPEKRRSTIFKSQRRRKIWRWLLKFWRAYRNAKWGKKWAKNLHKTMARVQKIAFFPSVFRPARLPQGSKTAFFRPKLRRCREQNFLWNILTIFSLTTNFTNSTYFNAQQFC